MSYNISSVKNKNTEENIRKLCDHAPKYIRDFAHFMEPLPDSAPADHPARLAQKSYAPSTRYTYLFSIMQFLQYMLEQPEYDGYTIETMPVDLFRDLSAEQIDSYISSLKIRSRLDHSEKEAASHYRNRILAAFKLFYQSLCLVEKYDFTCPVKLSKRTKVIRQSPVPFTSADIERLIKGIQTNNNFLFTSENEEGIRKNEVQSISEKTSFRRQRNISRNVAIISLIANEQLSVSEIAGMDVSDVSEVLNGGGTISFRTKNGVNETIDCSPATASYLKKYLDPPGIKNSIDKILAEQDPDIKNDFHAFCCSHMTNPNVTKTAENHFHNNEEKFLDDVRMYCMYLRESGRNAYSPDEMEQALFLSIRSKRISVRMIEQMVLDMTRTYLPDKVSEKNIGPDMLRMARKKFQ